MAPLLSLTQVTKRYLDGRRTILVLDRVSLEIDPGDYVGVWGPRRAGKTTLLKIAAGMEPPDEGTVCFDGRVVTAMSSRERSWLLRGGGVALVSSEWRPQVNRPAVDLVATACMGDGTPLHQARRRARRALALVDAGEQADVRADRLALAERIQTPEDGVRLRGSGRSVGAGMGLDIVPVVEPRATTGQGDREGQAPYRRGVRRGDRWAFWVAGLLALMLAGSLLVTASPGLAASPLTWSSPTLIDSHPPEPALDGVSCPSAGLCVAVDAFGNTVTSTEPTGGAGAWVLANVDGGNRIYGVSCMSEPLCVAVDGAGDVVASTDPRGGTGQWGVAHVDSGHELLGISCVSGPLCVAVDNGGNVITSTDPTGGEHAWTVTHVDDHLIRDVSCASASLCVAVDANGNVISSTAPTGESGAWTVSDVDSDDYILSISCPSEGLCVAVDGVGNVITSTKPASGAVAWSATGVDEHALGGVSCSSESRCVAFDGKGNVLTSTEPTKGKSAWSAAHVDPSNFLWGVSCTTGLCVAVNGNGNALTSTNPMTGAGSWSTAHIDSINPVWLLLRRSSK